jgi:hypothetical protein
LVSPGIIAQIYLAECSPRVVASANNDAMAQHNQLNNTILDETMNHALASRAKTRSIASQPSYHPSNFVGPANPLHRVHVGPFFKEAWLLVKIGSCHATSFGASVSAQFHFETSEEA